jgi:ubiquinone biosynthesis protein UbiJ
MNHLDRINRLGDPAKSPSGALKRRRQRAQAFRDLSPECERLVVAMMRAGKVRDGDGELAEQVARLLILAEPEAVASLAEWLEQTTTESLTDTLHYPPAAGLQKKAPA